MSPQTSRPTTAPAPLSDRWRRYFLHLYQRPALTLSLCCVVPLLLACAWTLAAQERQWRARESNHLILTARLAGRVLQEHLARIGQSAQALAEHDRFAADVAQHQRDAVDAQLRLLVRTSPELDAAEVRDASGRLLAHTYPVRAAVTDQIPELMPFGEPVSSVFLSRTVDGGKVVAISHQILEHGRRVGTLTVHLQLEAIGHWLENIRVEPEGFLYVADQRGKLVAYPFHAAPGRPKDVSDWVPVAHAASPAGQVVRFHQGLPAHPWTAAVVLVEPFRWRIVAQQPDAAMLGPFMRLAAACVALMVLLATAVILLLLRWGRVHQATLQLVAQQAELLRRSEQRHLIDRLRTEKPGGAHAH